MSVLTPSQKTAVGELLAAAKAKATSLIELRSSPALGRGQGVTSVLRAVASELDVELLGVATVLEAADTL